VNVLSNKSPLEIGLYDAKESSPDGASQQVVIGRPFGTSCLTRSKGEPSMAK